MSYLGSGFVVVDNANLQIGLLPNTSAESYRFTRYNFVYNYKNAGTVNEHSFHIQPHKLARSYYSSLK